MKIYCLDDFRTEFLKLMSKKSYHYIEQEIIRYFFSTGKSIQDLRSGTLLNNDLKTPYIKKRLGGSGGIRLYFLLIIVKDSVYLLFLHPKTGAFGSENITDHSKAFLYKKVLAVIESNVGLYEVSEDSGKLQFKIST